MKSILFIGLFFTLFIFTNSCKEKESDCPQPFPEMTYEIDVFQFQLRNKGVESRGYCGPTIMAYLDSAKTSLTLFKAINLPGEITFSLNTYYWGRFRVLPEVFCCIDGEGDPFPDRPTPTYTLQYVEIIEWGVK